MKKFISIKFIALTLVLFASRYDRLQAQDTTRLKMTEVLNRMDTSYPALLQYSQKLQAIQVQAQGATSWMPPTIELGFDRWGYNPMTWNERSPMNQSAIMISAEQMIPDPQKQQARGNAIRTQATPLQFDSAWLKNDLRLRARIYFLQRQIAERKLKILAQQLAVLDLLIQSAEARFTVNQVELSSIYKAKARRAELLNMQLMLQADIAESNIGLNTLMNRPVNTPFQIDTAVEVLSFPQPVVLDSIGKRSDIQLMNANIQVMQRQQDAMRAELRPSFGIRASHMQMLGMPAQFSLMGMMVIPIAPWSSGMYNSEIDAMNFRIQEMELQKQGMQLMAQQMAAEQFAMLQSALQQWKNYDSLIIPAYQNNYNAAYLSWQTNNESFFILLDAWEMLLMKKMEAEDQLEKVLLIQTRYQYELEQ